jgi:hypothetical protein
MREESERPFRHYAIIWSCQQDFPPTRLGDSGPVGISDQSGTLTIVMPHLIEVDDDKKIRT